MATEFVLFYLRHLEAWISTAHAQSLSNTRWERLCCHFSRLLTRNYGQKQPKQTCSSKKIFSILKVEVLCFSETSQMFSAKTEHRNPEAKTLKSCMDRWENLRYY